MRAADCKFGEPGQEGGRVFFHALPFNVAAKYAIKYRHARKNKKPGREARAFRFCRSLALTYFRAIYLALSSALPRFTVLFGMGRRGSRALWAPDITCGCDENA